MVSAISRRHDQTLRTSGAEQVGPVVALIVRRAGPRATFGPDAGEIKPVLKLKHHEIAEFTNKHGVNVEWLLEGKGRVFEKDPIRLSPNSTGAEFAAVVATMPMADQQAIRTMVRDLSQERNQAPAPIGQKTQPATDRRAFKAAEAVRTSPPVRRRVYN